MFFFFSFCKASATFNGRRGFFNMQVEGWMTEAWGGSSACAEFPSFLLWLRPDAAVTPFLHVSYLQWSKTGGCWGGKEVQNICKHFTLTSLFNVRQLNPKHLVKFGWVLLSWTMSSAEAWTNKCIKAQREKLQLTTFQIWSTFEEGLWMESGPTYFGLSPTVP